MKRVLIFVVSIFLMFLPSVMLFPKNAISAEFKSCAELFAEILPNLASPDLKLMEYAQQRLLELCFEVGAPGQETAKAQLNSLMVSQLDQPIDPVAKTWILYQLSRTASDDQVDPIAACLVDPDFRVCQQALRTLITINTDRALDAVKRAADVVNPEFRKEIQQTLDVASYDLKIPTETEWPLCLPYVDDAQVEAWLADYDSFDVTTQARTIASLAVRNDRKYRSYAVEAAKSDDPDLRSDGILALEKLGTSEDIPLLIQFAKVPEFERLAIVTADRIEYPGFDEAILEGLKNTGDQEDFFNYTKIAVARFNFSALPIILDGAAKYEDIRANLLDWVEPLMKREYLPRYVDLMLQVKSTSDRENLQRSVTRIVDGDASQIIAKINNVNRHVLIPLVGRIGGKESFDYLFGLFESGDIDAKELAVKGLANMPNAEHAEILLAIATDSGMSQTSRVAAMRAYIRVMSLPEDEIGIVISEEEKLRALKSAFEAAERDEEKNFVLERMKAIRLPETLMFVMQYIDDPRFVDSATITVLGLAHHDFLRKKDPQAFAGALNKIVEMNLSADWVDAARRYLAAMRSIDLGENEE